MKRVKGVDVGIPHVDRALENGAVFEEFFAIHRSKQRFFGSHETLPQIFSQGSENFSPIAQPGDAAQTETESDGAGGAAGDDAPLPPPAETPDPNTADAPAETPSDPPASEPDTTTPGDGG